MFESQRGFAFRNGEKIRLLRAIHILWHVIVDVGAFLLGHSPLFGSNINSMNIIYSPIKV